MKNRLKQLLPNWLISLIRRFRIRIMLCKEYLRDLKRFEQSASLHSGQKKVDHLRARITYHYHAIEKGLSNPSIRLGFGKNALNSLHSVLQEYNKQNFSKDDVRYRTAISTIKEYIKYHEQQNFDVSEVKDLFEKFLTHNDESLGGVHYHDNKNTIYNRNMNFFQVVNQRSSVRTFSKENVDIDLINEAIQLSMRTPSVCNRQPWKTHVLKNKETQRKVLQLQMGFKGYENSLDTLIVVTSDNQYLLGINERNQGFIDGGMFSMSLLYALEYVGLAACPLNASQPAKNEEQIRKILNIPFSESLIMFIAVGHFPNNYKIPKSKRDDYEEITTYVM